MNWFNALKTLTIIAFIFLLNTRQLAKADDVLDESAAVKNVGDSLPTDSLDAMAKRAWQQLHGSWGKRLATDDDQMQRNFDDGPDYEPTQLLTELNANSYDYLNAPQTSQSFEKRAWKSLNGAWGKRDWSQMKNNGWGKKREPGNWNNLRGLWGKRSSPQSWSKLSSGWGK